MNEFGFDAGVLSARYAQLDALPDSLFEPTLLNPLGTLPDRVAGLLAWRAALLAGSLPRVEEVGWPPAELFTPLQRELARLELPRFCRGETELTDALLLSVLDAVARGMTWLDQRTNELAEQLRKEEEAQRLDEQRRLRELQEKFRKPSSNQGTQAAQGAGRPPSGNQSAAVGAVESSGGSPAPEDAVSVLDEKTLRRLRREAERLARLELPEALAARLRAEWAERSQLWIELSEVFGELSQLLGCGWDLGRGVLRSRGWLEMMRLHELLKALPALRDLIQLLGRMQHSPSDSPSVLEQIFVDVRRAREDLRQVRSPLVPMETRGIERSGELSRMLPSEAMLLGHPTLKLLWHARRAERGLLSYRVEGTDWERATLEEAGKQAAQRPQTPRQRGPILVCVDTSGSMAGLPEQVAKALALEAVRTAHAEKRRLYVYLFSGPNQVAEQELALSKAGLTQLLKLLTMSFHGGTDVAAPLSRASERLSEPAFSRADILLVSDGEFPVSAATLVHLEKARAQYGTRVHGVLIGAGDGAAMRSLCDQDRVHRCSDWAELARLPKGFDTATTV